MNRAGIKLKAKRNTL